MDKRVIDHCASHKLCTGCRLNCVAPVSDREFFEWVKSQEKKIIEYLQSIQS